MKQSLRLVTRPKTFFSQLQWSSQHWGILAAFLILAGIETHTGSQQIVNTQFAQLLELKLGVSSDVAVWLFTAVRLSLVIAGAFLVSFSVWFVGNLFGRRTSQRVLFRRLAVVFTVLLASYTLNHVSYLNPSLLYISWALGLWGAMLGYYAIKEQFGLAYSEAALIGIFGAIMAVSTWHYSNQFVQKTLHKQIEEVARTHSVRGGAVKSYR